MRLNPFKSQSPKPSTSRALSSDSGRERAAKESAPEAKPFELNMARSVEERKTPGDSSIESLLQDVESYRKQLLDEPSIQNFNRYREGVRSVFRKAVPNAYRMATEYGKVNPKSMERREYRLLREVDDKLAEVLRRLRTESLRGFELAQATEAIKGLLFDVSR